MTSLLIRLLPIPTAEAPALNHDSIFPPSTPPVGINNKSGNTSFTELMNPDPTVPAGNILTKPFPDSFTCINSVGVIHPGIHKIFFSAASLASSFEKPGLTRKSAPYSRAFKAVFDSNTVPRPIIKSGNCLIKFFFISLKFFKACFPRLVYSITRMPAAYNASLCEYLSFHRDEKTMEEHPVERWTE